MLLVNLATYIAGALVPLGLVARHWGQTKLGQLDERTSARAELVYALAWRFGGAVSIVGGCVAAALLAAR